MTDPKLRDVYEDPDGTGEAPHPMGPHGDPNYRDDEPLEGDIVPVDGEVIDSRD